MKKGRLAGPFSFCPTAGDLALAQNFAMGGGASRFPT